MENLKTFLIGAAVMICLFCLVCIVVEDVNLNVRDVSQEVAE